MRYCVSMINWMDNDLWSEIIEADSEEDALRSAFYILNHSAYPDDEDQSIEGIKRFAFDCDGMVNAIEID